MSLNVETGSGASDSESYASVADADTHFGNRGVTAWTALSTPEKEANLRLATDYMVQAYRLRWAGFRVTNTQALDWPRDLVPRSDALGSSITADYYANDAVPAEVVRACCDLAYRASQGDLLADLDPPVKREKIGPIEVEYAEGARQTKRYPAVDALLAPLFASTTHTMKVSRA